MGNMYKCPFCTKKIKQLSILKAHVKKIHLLYGLYCPYCIEFFGSLQLLQNHLISVNDEYHQNLYYLITGRYVKRVNKKLFIDNNIELTNSEFAQD